MRGLASCSLLSILFPERNISSEKLKIDIMSEGNFPLDSFRPNIYVCLIDSLLA